MGQDKAEIALGGRALLDRAIEVLGTVCDEVLLATGSAPRYVERGHGIVLDRAPDLGPLAALEVALTTARHERVLVLAVDMPAVDAELLELLFEQAERDDCDALALGSPNGVEPLCAVYHVRIAPAVRAALDAGERRMTAPFTRAAVDAFVPRLDVLDAARIGFADALRNVNTHLDLERARGETAHGVCP